MRHFRLSHRGKFLLLAAGCVMAVGLFWHTVHLSLCERSEELRTETEMHAMQSAEIVNFMNGHPDFPQYMEELGKQRERADRALPDSLEQGRFLGMLQQCALDHNILLQEIVPAEIRQEKEWYYLPIHLKLTCNYFQLIDFLEQLNAAERFMALQDMEVRKKEDALSCELTLHVYAITEKEDRT